MIELHPLIDFINNVLAITPHLLFSIVGSTVGLLINGACENGCSFKLVFGRIIAGLFVGFLAIFVAQEAGFTDAWTMVLVGLASFTSVDILPLLKKRVVSKVSSYGPSKKD